MQAPGATPTAIYEGARRFHFSALVQATDLSTYPGRSLVLPWAMAFTDELDNERFYLTNTDLLRELPPLIQKIRTLPSKASLGHRMLNQGFPCFLFLERAEGLVRMNVSQYREGRDKLLSTDITLDWEEFHALIAMGLRALLTDLCADFPVLLASLGPVIDAFNQLAADLGVVPFAPPQVELAPDDEAPEPAGSRKRVRRRSPLTTPVYLLEWRTHKDQNLRLNSALTVTYGVLFAVALLSALFRLEKIPLGFPVFALLAIGLPWFLVQRYPAIPLHSPLWTERGVKFRVFFPDTVLLLSTALLLLAAWSHEANILWVAMFPLGWLLCLFCGLGFPRTHWAKPIWDWSRGGMIASLLLATALLYVMADLGRVYFTTLDRPANEDPPPRVAPVSRLQESVDQWTSAPARVVAKPVAHWIDEYSSKKAIHEYFPAEGFARTALAWLFRFSWVGGSIGFALGLRWAQLPSPTQVAIRSSRWK